jgi:hypothetical protein
VKNKIDLLESLGYKVHLKHVRTRYPDASAPPNEKGGHTIAIIKKGDEVVVQTWAHCLATENYNKKIGANIALGRAIHALGLFKKGQAKDLSRVPEWENPEIMAMEEARASRYL